jgi:hypothetical protein
VLSHGGLAAGLSGELCVGEHDDRSGFELFGGEREAHDCQDEVAGDFSRVRRWGAW